MFGGYDGQRCFNDIDVLDLDTVTWRQPKTEGIRLSLFLQFRLQLCHTLRVSSARFSLLLQQSN